ncbi:hypothetical protein D3C85_1373210 [compost metagenome]
MLTGLALALQYPEHGIAQLFDIDTSLAGVLVAHIEEIAVQYSFDQARYIAAFTWTEYDARAGNHQLACRRVACLPYLMDFLRGEFRTAIGG